MDTITQADLEDNSGLVPDNCNKKIIAIKQIISFGFPVCVKVMFRL